MPTAQQWRRPANRVARKNGRCSEGREIRNPTNPLETHMYNESYESLSSTLRSLRSPRSLLVELASYQHTTLFGRTCTYRLPSSAPDGNASWLPRVHMAVPRHPPPPSRDRTCRHSSWGMGGETGTQTRGGCGRRAWGSRWPSGSGRQGGT